MKRSLASLIIIVASAACTDSEAAPNEVSQNRATEGDSSVVVVVSNHAGAPALGAKVTNAGEPCALLGRDCQGSASQCLEVSASGAFYSGGYCTADCLSLIHI